MSPVAPLESELAELPVDHLIDQFFEDVVEDLPYDDVTGRLQRRQHVIDRLKLEFSKDAARLAAQFETENAGDLLDAPTAGEWIRHNCKTSRSVAYDCINVGQQLPRIAKCAAAVVAGEIGFAHLSVIARTASALTKSTPESVFVEDELLERAKESSAGRLWHYCMRLRHALDPEGVAREQRIAVEERRLQFTVWDDGSLLISGQLDPIGGAAVRTAFEPIAQPMGQGDDRCLEHRQADAFVELATHSLDAGLVPQHASQRPHLQLTTSLETLQGLPGSPAADMEFSTPIAAVTVQRLACDCEHCAGRVRSGLRGGRRRPSGPSGLRHNPPRAERPPPALPVARLRAYGILERRASPRSLGPRWPNRSLQPHPDLSSTPLDGARGWVETGPIG